MPETKLTFQDSALGGRTGKARTGLVGRRRRVGALGGRTGKARTALLVGAAESAP